MADERRDSLFDANGLECWIPNQILFSGEEWSGGGYLAMAKFIADGDHVVFCSGGDLNYSECLIGVRRMGVYWQWTTLGEDFVGVADNRCVVYFGQPLAVAGVRLPVYRVRPMFTAFGLRCYYEDIFEAKFYESMEDALIEAPEHAVDLSEYLNLIRSASPGRK
jgi:hypothetical protein